MRALEIHLKGGGVLTVDATDVTTKRHGVTNELVGLNWVTPKDAKRKLHTVEIEDIVALVVIA